VWIGCLVIPYNIVKKINALEYMNKFFHKKGNTLHQSDSYPNLLGSSCLLAFLAGFAFLADFAFLTVPKTKR
jgi:hypothetical protein